APQERAPTRSRGRTAARRSRPPPDRTRRRRETRSASRRAPGRSRESAAAPYPSGGTAPSESAPTRPRRARAFRRSRLRAPESTWAGLRLARLRKRLLEIGGPFAEHLLAKDRFLPREHRVPLLDPALEHPLRLDIVASLPRWRSKSHAMAREQSGSITRRRSPGRAVIPRSGGGARRS